MSSNYQTTPEGLELHIGTNHFGHFLLTNLLLETLKASTPSRIVVVASLFHKMGKINRDDLNFKTTKYSQWSAYAQSKLANILFTRALAKRLQGTGVVVNSLCPGGVKTDITRDQNIFMKLLFFVIQFLYKTPKSGAQTSIALAVDPDLEKVSGKYFSDCKIVAESKEAQDDETAEWLWNKSEEITGL